MEQGPERLFDERPILLHL